jgi:hypothetical protein
MITREYLTQRRTELETQQATAIFRADQALAEEKRQRAMAHRLAGSIAEVDSLLAIMPPDGPATPGATGSQG